MKIKKEKAITLISLVITIIILIIIAGISIIALQSNNGLLSNAKIAKKNTLDVQNVENETLSEYENSIDNYVANSRESKIKVQTLWENPNESTVDFTAQNITLANDEYDYFDIIYRFFATEPAFSTKRVYKGYTFILSETSGYSNNCAHRYGNYVNDTTYNISAAYWAGNINPNNKACIPVKIIGYKF